MILRCSRHSWATALLILVLAPSTAAVYPNPFRSELNVQVPSGWRSADIIVFDVLGRQISQKAAAAVRSFDGAHMPPGVYFVVVDSGDRLLRTTAVKLD
ncbi:MAG: T9SS type A sorting domain-containing protein [Rhodothermales bacterium]|nr:T9SS type A sorting domain-containing protein [Rhodothermales bacterium]MBO6781472.1 T9SS type A sorting domain-containing protein [Rhodothermales bacterium]